MTVKKKGENPVSTSINGQSRCIALFTSPQNKAILTVVLLMGLEVFAALYNGAFFLGPMTLYVIGAWVILLYLLFAGPDDNSQFFPPHETILMTLLFTLLVWTGLSMFWSISRNLTWIEFNRTGGYVAIFIIATYVGRHKQARNLVSILFVSLVTSAAFYAISAKIFPSLVTNTLNETRISIPIGYVNALGLLMAILIILALCISARGDLHWLFRSFAIVTLPLYLIVLFFTLSRGSYVALAGGLLIYYTFSPLRLRSFGIMLISFLPVSLVALWSNGQEALMVSKSELSLRQVAASDLRLYLLSAIVITLVLFASALVAGKQISFSSRVIRYTGYMTLGLVIVVSIASTFYFINSRELSFPDWVRHSYKSFISKSEEKPVGFERVFILSSSHRWELWNEAVSNWEEHPVTGTGAQSFHLVHLMNRKENIPFVKQPHGLPFRLLSELGIVAFVTMGAFIAYSLTICTLVIYRIRDRWQKGLAASFLAVVVTYLIHTSYDWDWNMFALTMPYFLFTGILVGWYGSLRGSRKVAAGAAEGQEPPSGSSSSDASTSLP